IHFMHWYYRSYFENKFVDRSESSYLLSKDLKRLASKISRCLAHFDESEIRYESQDELFCGVITKLERSVSRFAEAEKTAAVESDKSWAAVFADHYHEPMKSELSGNLSGRWTESLETITVDSNNRFYFVLKNGLDASAVNNCVQNAKRI